VRTAEDSVGPAVVDVVEEVQCLDTEVEGVFAAGATSTEHAAHTAPASAAESARTESASGRSAATTAAPASAAIMRPAVGVGTGRITGFGAEAEGSAYTQVDCHRCRAFTHIRGNERFSQ